MKQVKGWWFGATDKKLGYGDGRKIIIGETHKVEGDIIPCERGLHLSKNIIDALQYAPGPVIYCVVGSGTIIPHGTPCDKYACSERTYISGGIDISNILRKFARMCALDVIHRWDAPDVVIRYLKTGDESIRDAAWAAARAASWTATRSFSASEVERDAARAAAWAAGIEVARDTARAAKWAFSARAAAWDKQNRRLTAMVKRALKDTRK